MQSDSKECFAFVVDEFFWLPHTKNLDSWARLFKKTRYPAVKNTFEVIVKKSSPKNLSADCRSTVSCQLTDRLPTVYRQTCAFHLASCPRSTLRDFVGIAELKKVDSRELDLVLRDQGVTSVRDLKVVCRKRLRHYIPVMSNMRREGQLLPVKFEARFYEWSILLIFHHSKNGFFRSHQIYESQWPTIKFKLSNKYISLLSFLLLLSRFFFVNENWSNSICEKPSKKLRKNIWDGLRHSLPFQHAGKQCCSCVNSLVSFGFCGASLM